MLRKIAVAFVAVLIFTLLAGGEWSYMCRLWEPARIILSIEFMAVQSSEFTEL